MTDIDILVHLRDRVTGMEGVLPFKTPDLDCLDYMWGMGNYSCDCNRICFLAEANPAWAEAVDDEIDCNSSHPRIVVDRITDMHGTVLYRDDA